MDGEVTGMDGKVAYVQFLSSIKNLFSSKQWSSYVYSLLNYSISSLELFLLLDNFKGCKTNEVIC